MIPEEQPPIELSEKVREYLKRMFSAARIEDTRKDRLVKLNTIPSKIAEAKVYYFDRAISPDILVAGAWMYIGGEWIQVSNNPEAWTEVTAYLTGETYDFSNGWSNFGSPRATVAFYKFAKEVHLKGDCVKAGGGTDVIFTLPTGYRPPADMTFKAAGDSNHAEVQIKTDGTVNRLSGSAGTFFSLNGISFRI